MADEHVLRIEFQGDDGSGNRPEDQGAQGQSQQDRSDRYEEDRDYVREAHEEAQRRFEDEVRRAAANNPNDPLPHGSDGRSRYSEPEVEEVDEKPRYSNSRELVPYDPDFANISGRPDPIFSARGPSVAAEPVAAAEAGFGGGGGLPPTFVPPAAAAGAGGFGEVGAAILAIAEPALAVGVALVGVAAATVGVTEAMSDLHDELLREFEQVNGIIGAARAQQEAELLQKRYEVSQGIAPGAAATISAQTEMEKQMIELNGRFLQATEVILVPLLKIATGILDGVNGILDFIFGPIAPQGIRNFQQDAIDWLSNLPHNLAPKENSGMKRPVPNSRRKLRRP